jgi:soluble lytic murein transglycosylase-like protein
MATTPEAQSAQNAEPRLPVAPTCTQIPAERFNSLLRARRQITGKKIDRSQIATAPVCLHRFNDLKRKVKRLRADCTYAKDAVRCWITAAAKKYGQPLSDAFRVADCESDFNPGLTNSEAVGSEYATGLFQFLPSTWATTPYRNRNIFSAKWNSLAAMWMWSVGRRGEWACT